jgi:uncharacterized protein YjdB
MKKMTRQQQLPLVALLLLALTFVYAGCKKDKNDPTKADKVLVINNGARTMSPDEQPTYTAKFVTVDGKTETANGVTWSSSSTGIASISAGGVVTAASVGSVTITATVVEDGVTYTAAVPLGIQGATAFVVAPSAIIYEPGGSLQLETFYFGTTVPSYTYSSSNASVASVSSTGLVTFNATGSCVISVEASTHPGAPFIVPVLVVGPPVIKLPITEIQVTPATVNLFRGETQQMSAQAYNLDGATSATFTWSVSDPNVATISSSGLLTARGVGNAYIFASAQGITAQAEVYVSPDTVIEITPYIASVTAGGTRQFVAKAYNARNGMTLLPGITTFNWFVPSYGFSMFDFATVNQSGLVSVNSNALPGNLTFVAASLPSNPDIGAASIVMVSICDCGPGNANVNSISIQNGSSVNMSLFSSPTLQLNAVARDAAGNTVANPGLKFCSDSQAVVNVDPDTGELFAAGPGTATVTVCSGPYAEASITVNVSF